ncbi:VOC family protein [Vineibacter terrae]|uniref:VOC family protein n=1 Tax=Vineibacter terrae TaxID=2586908 RepID=A0A5C8PF20_9HYPH|nr:VOC family protein [Vineibacter terrae]TXL72374.1 VOC family protein [Vineibacter terrae]
MKQINPYLKFNGNCREAMTFYKDCLGGELTLNTVAGSPMEAAMPAAMKDLVLHAVLSTGAATVMGSDMSGPNGVSAGNNMTICVVCESREEIETAFARMAEGGTIKQPLSQQPFGMYGDLIDKYGYAWMFQFTGA